MVAHLDGVHLQDVAGFLESGEPRSKYDPNSARPGLAAEMDRLAPDRLGHLHALLFERFSPTSRAGLVYRDCAAARETRENARFDVVAQASCLPVQHTTGWKLCWPHRQDARATLDHARLPS